MLIYLALAPLVSLGSQAVTILAARGLERAAELMLTSLLPNLPVDPVYTSAMVYGFGDVEPLGLAIAGAFGDSLHEAWPDVFSPSEYVQEGAVASAVIESGASLSASIVARGIGSYVLLVLLMVVMMHGGQRTIVKVAGLLLQIHVLIDLAPEIALSKTELDASGLPLMLAAFSPVAEDGRRPLFTSALAPLPDVLVGTLCVLVFSFVLYGLGRIAATAIVATTTMLASRPPLERRTVTPPARTDAPGALRSAATTTIAALVLLSTASALGVLVDSERVFVDDEPEVSEAPLDIADLPGSHQPSGKPSLVRLEQGTVGFRLMVNGEATTVRGVGYNPWYAHLDPADRRARYSRDFRAIRQTGANVLEGWFEQQFDETTLALAHQHGLGVLMPFELNQDHDYANPAVQQALLEQVSAWVPRYRDEPAVWMWAPGNEVLHRLIFPTLVRGSRNPDMERRAADFASFYVRLIDTIHALDPDHPVLYRDAEDGYLPYLDAALRDGVDRSWFIYGANAYTPRIEQIVRDWQARGLKYPLLFSEFAPTGHGPLNRPKRLEWFWSVIRSEPDLVLGGVIYTWSTEGPEELDRVFGLTDSQGLPVDESVATLSRLYRGTELGRD